MKLKRYIKKSVVLLIGLLITTSCENWLNLEPENDLIVQEFWQKKSDVDAVMAAMYDAFRETSLESIIWGECRADVMEITASKFGNYALILNNDITPSNGAIYWSEYYKAINLANTILQYAGNVVELDNTFTESEKLSYDAEALFIRSLCYFYLVRLWKTVPLITSATSSDTVNLFVSNYELANETAQGYSGDEQEKAVLEYIIQDLKKAESIAYTTQHVNEPDIFYGRANKYSIQALIADIYLWLEDYSSCIEYCNKVIESNRYLLLDQNSWFQLYYPGNSRESIFEIQFHSEYEGESNPMYDALTPIVGTLGIKPTDEYVSLFTTGDIRYFSSGYGPALKYLCTSSKAADRRIETEKDANIIYYRYADILLMKAEAKAETSEYREANQLINEIKTRAGIPVTTIDENLKNFRDAILLERAREFSFEGKRWFDLLRFAKKNNFENTTLIQSVLMSHATVKNKAQLESRVRNPWYFYLPIPDEDINSNYNMEQNPFYDDDSKIY